MSRIGEAVSEDRLGILSLQGDEGVKTPLCGMLISRVDSIACGKNSCTISRVSSIK